MLIIGSILAIVGALGTLVFWIMSIVKAFQNKEVLWGVLSIILGPILALIWLFMRGQTGLAMKIIISAVVYIVGAILLAVGGAVSVQEMPPQP